MVKETQYISINRIVDESLRHPLLSELTLEQAISYTLTFIAINGLPNMYQDKIDIVEIKDFRGMLPCDLISITQVKDTQTGICLRSMTDSFPKGMEKRPYEPPKTCPPPYISPRHHHFEELSFKTQGRVIFTSFPEGAVEIAYKSIPVDENGYPMIMNNEVYLAALKAYIKQEMFTVKFDEGKISAQVLQNAQTEYCWAVGRLNSEYMIPSLSELESMARTLNTMISKRREFDQGFTHTGSREYLRKW